MMSNDSIINVETKTIEWANDKIVFITIRTKITIYHTYRLLYRKEHIQMISIDIIINVETKHNRMNEMAKLHSF